MRKKKPQILYCISPKSTVNKIAKFLLLETWFDSSECVGQLPCVSESACKNGKIQRVCNECFSKFAWKCVICLSLIVIFLLKIFQSSNSNDSMTWVSFTNLFTFSIYIAVKRSSSPQGLISIHCRQCKLLSAFVLLWFLPQSSLTRGVLWCIGAQMTRSGAPYLKDFIGAGPQRLQCSKDFHVFWTTHPSWS